MQQWSDLGDRPWVAFKHGWVNLTWAHFTNEYFIVIQIRWIIHIALIQIVINWSLQNSAYDTTAQLSWHVQKLAAITWAVNEAWICNDFELEW